MSAEPTNITSQLVKQKMAALSEMGMLTTAQKRQVNKLLKNGKHLAAIDYMTNTVLATISNKATERKEK